LGGDKRSIDFDHFTHVRRIQNQVDYVEETREEWGKRQMKYKETVARKLQASDEELETIYE
jgi:hypothetical protein